MIRSAALFVPLALLIGIISYFIYRSETKRDLNRVKMNEVIAVGAGIESVNHKLETIAADLGYLATHDALKAAFGKTDQAGLDHVAADFSHFIQKKRIYDKARWIDETGRERLRVEYVRGKAVVLPPHLLQNKSNRYYVSDILRLGAGQIYISPFDLNVEHDRVEIPYKPVIRIGTPLSDKSGKKRGILILNYFGNDMIGNFVKAASGIADHAMLLNREGYWLHSPAADDEWGFMFQRKENFASRYPQAWKQISNSENGQFETAEGLWTFGTVYPLFAGQRSLSSSASLFSGLSAIDRKQYFWKIVSLVPAKAIATAGSDQLPAIILYSLPLLIIAFLGSWKIAKSWVEQRDAQAEVQRIALRMTMLLENLGEGVFGLDKDGKCIFINPAALSMVGYERTEVLGKDPRRIFRDSAFPNVSQTESLDEKPGEDNRRSGEDWFVRKDGRKFPVQLFETPILQNNALMGSVVAFQDISERKWADAAVRKQIEFTEMLISNSSAAIFVLAEGHKVMYWNNACEKLTGVPASEITGTDNHWKPFYVEKRPCLADLVLEGRLDSDETLYEIVGPSPLLQGGLHAEGWYRKLGGRDRYLTIESAPIRNSEGRIFAAIETIQDITGHKNAEEAKRESEFRYRLLIENSPDAVFLQSEGRFIYLNPAGIKLFGASGPEDLLGTRVIDRIHPDFQAMVRERMRMVMEENKAAAVAQETFLRLDGSAVSVEVLAIPFRYFERPAAQVIVRDVTERKQMISELQNVKQRLELAIDSGQLGIWDWDIENDKMVWNDRMLDLYGMERGELAGTGRDWERHVHPLDFQRAAAAMSAALGGEGDYDVDFRAVHPDGRILDIKADGIVIRNAEGKAVRMIGMNRDVTERKQLEEQLRQAQKMEAIGTLAGGIAHDFNNILTAIVGSAHLLQTSMQINDPLLADVRQIVQSAERAAHLTQGLLAFSRKQAIKVQLIELGGTIRRFEQFLTRLIGEDMDLRTETGREQLNVLIDQSQLEQILMNLATNARDAMPKGGVLSIHAAGEEMTEDFVRSRGFGKPGTYARLTVTDNGTGMEESVRRRVFDPFFTTKEVGKGTGLGLAIVYGIVKQHQGYIDVCSKPGEGSSFHIYLPIASVEQGQAVAMLNLVGKIPGGSETILVVEDDTDVRRIIQQTLLRFGYTVITADDGDEAILTYLSHAAKRVELVITDVVMPGKNGLQVYEELRKRTPGIKILFMSGYTADLVTLKELTDAGLPFIAKPINPEMLLIKVREILEV